MIKQEISRTGEGNSEFAVATYSIPCDEGAQDVIIANGFSSGMGLSSVMARRLVAASHGQL